MSLFVAMQGKTQLAWHRTRAFFISRPAALIAQNYCLVTSLEWFLRIQIKPLYEVWNGQTQSLSKVCFLSLGIATVFDSCNNKCEEEAEAEKKYGSCQNYVKEKEINTRWKCLKKLITYQQKPGNENFFNRRSEARVTSSFVVRTSLSSD